VQLAAGTCQPNDATSDGVRGSIGMERHGRSRDRILSGRWVLSALLLYVSSYTLDAWGSELEVDSNCGV
jgi:hypothetical protein